jgi:hypothetical protein
MINNTAWFPYTNTTGVIDCGSVPEIDVDLQLPEMGSAGVSAGIGFLRSVSRPRDSPSPQPSPSSVGPTYGASGEPQGLSRWRAKVPHLLIEL